MMLLKIYMYFDFCESEKRHIQVNFSFVSLLCSSKTTEPQALDFLFLLKLRSDA